jgi:4-aminobutyrate aminotransferase-like enzyme/Ser/Thr protein kinase RdoA (MazF antagonist)
VAVPLLDPLSIPAPTLAVESVRQVLAEHWHIEGALTPLHGERDLNFRVTTTEAEYLLKVHNPADDESVLDMQTRVLAHIAATDPGLPVGSVVPTAEGHPWAAVHDTDGRRSFVRMLDWLPGRHPERLEFTGDVLAEWGRVTARLARAMRGFVHSAAAYPIAWDIRRLPTLRPWVEAVTTPASREIIEAFIDRFDETVSPSLAATRAQVLHNDIAPTNLLIDGTGHVSGITDFGDMTHTSLICDLAVAVADAVNGRSDALAAVPRIVAGYESVIRLEDDEAALLPELVAGRAVAAVVISAWRTRELGWAPDVGDGYGDLLRLLLDAGVDEVRDQWQRTRRGLWGDVPSAVRSSEALEAARARTFGVQELSYRRPVHLVAGDGVMLRDAEGRQFLDAYNNVPVVGHSHPAVAEAVAAQLRRLNTNSRYLQDAPVELAERLLATLPSRFDRVLFVNSGSEANDLAWRIARFVTGGSGGIATRWAYHGVTEATFAFSPESWNGEPGPAHIALVDPPWPGKRPDAGGVVDFAAAAARLRADGHPPAMVMIDGVFTSDGILGPAHAWTQAAAAAAHDAGALYVADEVQAGFGRTGDHLWSFVAGDVPADLVTVGKPMGNGYPVAAVFGPAELIDPFVRGTDYFSTFGGGTAACVAALAVLQTLDAEGLVARAASVGARLREVLTEVAAERTELAAVRGWGLAVGVDVVDPATGAPDAERATRVVEEMRDRGVLIGRTAATRSTLKIRPPLVFGNEHVALVAEALAASTR